jgi:hypothetical protein
MLLTSAELDGIRDGRITMAFRSWTRPTVKTGGRLRTAIGELEIVRVEPCELESLTVRDARAAGYGSMSALAASLTATLAKRVGQERDHFKQNVRKLKELGLTESLEIGYRLSPGGRAYLQQR